MSFSSPLRLISKPLSSAKVPSSLKTAYLFFIRIPSSLEAGRIMAYYVKKMRCEVHKSKTYQSFGVVETIWMKKGNVNT